MISTNELNGKWHNEHGSCLTLRLGESNRLTGKFSSGVGLARPGEEFDVVGFAADDLVAFAVNFGKYDTLTSWSGHLFLENGAATIRALWQMIITPPLFKGQEQTWKATWTGADVFRREAPSSALRHSMPSHPVSWSEFVSPTMARDSSRRREP